MKKILLVFFFVLILVGCKKDNYKAGTVKDGVYTNERLGFKLEPKTTAIRTGDDAKESSYYTLAANDANKRGNASGFKCDCYIDDSEGEILVLSEKNSSKLSMDEFAKKVEDCLKKGILSYNISENSDISVGDITFRHIKGEGLVDVVNYYILEDGDRFTYIFHACKKGNDNGGNGIVGYIKQI